MMDFFMTAEAVAIFPFFHIPERSIAVKRLAGSPKKLKLIPTCPNKVLLKVAHVLIYMDGLL
jgi:hypothetical protein